MEYVLLRKTIKNKKLNDQIMKEYNSIIQIKLPLFFVREKGDNEEILSAIMQRNNFFDSKKSVPFEKYIVELSKYHATSNNKLAFRAITSMLIKKNGYIKLSNIYKNILNSNETSDEFVEIINQFSKTLCDYCLITDKYREAFLYTNIFDEEHYRDYETLFYQDGSITTKLISKERISAFLSHFLKRVYSIKNDEMNEEYVLLSNNFINDINNLPYKLNRKEYRLLCFMYKKILDICFFPSLFQASINSKSEKIGINVQLILRIFSIINNDEIKKYLFLSRRHIKKEFVLNDFTNCIKVLRKAEELKTHLRIKSINYKTAYYTKIETIKYIFDGLGNDFIYNDQIGKLSLMHYAYMNDPNEGKRLVESFGCKIDNAELYYPLVFMKCFTTRKDDIPMWEMYGDKAKGCCIELDWENMLKKSYNIPLYSVCYLDKYNNAFVYSSAHNVLKQDQNIETIIQEIQTIKENISKVNMFIDMLSEVKFLFKNIEYGYEGEFRILYFEDEGYIEYTKDNIPKLFKKTNFNVNVKEIIIGPKCQNTADVVPYLQKKFEELNEYLKYDEITKIVKSEVHYK